MRLRSSLSLGPTPPPPPSSVCSAESSSSWNSASLSSAVERIIYVPTGKVSSAFIIKQWKKEPVWPFFCCYTADSLTDTGRHQLYNNGSLILFSTACSLHKLFLAFVEIRKLSFLDFIGWLPYRPLRTHHMGLRENHRRQDRHPQTQFTRL